MELRKEIILCYSTKDNEPLSAGQKGWVDNFYKFLCTLLSQIRRDEPKITFAPEESFSKMELDGSAAIIAVITPELTRHSDFLKRLNEFGKNARENNTLVVDGIPRFFKVLKGPFDEEEYLPEFAHLITYDFFMVDPLSGEAQEFTRFFGNDAERSYWMKLVDMAYDINQILNSSEKKSKVKAKQDLLRDKTVYLASTGVDMVIQRDIIKRELIRHGYSVLPNHSLPKEVKTLEKMVKEDLAKCRLSIHLVGEDYGYKPKGSDLSVVDLQNQIASGHTRDMKAYNETAKEKKPFSRLIWVSPDLNNVSERQKIFIEDLKSEAATLDEAEVLQITLQELKSIIREELVTGGRFNTGRKITSQELTEYGKEKVIYLIHDRRDREETGPIQKYLEKSGYRVVAPSFEGDLVDIRYIHQENLRRCDGSIIYFGQATEAWIKTKLQDLLKAPGFGRDTKIQAKAVYLDGEKEIDVDHYARNNAMVLGNNGGFKPEHLKPFITKLEKQNE